MATAKIRQSLKTQTLHERLGRRFDTNYKHVLCEGLRQKTRQLLWLLVLYCGRPTELLAVQARKLHNVAFYIIVLTEAIILSAAECRTKSQPSTSSYTGHNASLHRSTTVILFVSMLLYTLYTSCALLENLTCRSFMARYDFPSFSKFAGMSS